MQMKNDLKLAKLLKIKQKYTTNTVAQARFFVHNNMLNYSEKQDRWGTNPKPRSILGKVIIKMQESQIYDGGAMREVE